MEESDFNKLCRLCHIALSEEEKTGFLKNLDAILAYVQQLEEVDTAGVAPCFTVHETVRTLLRQDSPEEPLSHALFLQNAPSHVGGMIRVPPVLKQ